MLANGAPPHFASRISVLASFTAKIEKIGYVNPATNCLCVRLEHTMGTFALCACRKFARNDVARVSVTGTVSGEPSASTYRTVSAVMPSIDAGDTHCKPVLVTPDGMVEFTTSLVGKLVALPVTMGELMVKLTDPALKASGTLTVVYLMSPAQLGLASMICRIRRLRNCLINGVGQLLFTFRT